MNSWREAISLIFVFVALIVGIYMYLTRNDNKVCGACERKERWQRANLLSEAQSQDISDDDDSD